MPSTPVGTQLNFGEVHSLGPFVPTLKSRTTTKEPFGAWTLNWKVSGPAPESVARAVQAMGVPTTCGEAADGCSRRTATRAEAGIHNVDSAVNQRNAFRSVFMRLPSS